MSKSHQIGLMIRSCRESRGISQEYMAEMLDMAQSAYAYLESGKTTLSVDRLLRITEILQLDIHHIIEESKMEMVQTKTPDNYPASSANILLPDTKEAYDQLILELRSEIDFLRSLIRKES